jgi:hypothetical protein
MSSYHQPQHSLRQRRAAGNRPAAGGGPVFREKAFEGKDQTIYAGMQSKRRGNYKESSVFGCCPFHVDVYGAMFLLSFTILLWICICSALVLAPFSGIQTVVNSPFLFCWSTIKMGISLWSLQMLCLSVITLHRPVYSTVVTVLKFLLSVRVYATVFTYTFLGGVLLSSALGWASNYTFALVHSIDSTDKTCNLDYQATLTIFHGSVTGFYLGVTFFVKERYIMWIPELTLSWSKELPSRIFETLVTSCKVAVFLTMMGTLSSVLFAEEDFNEHLAIYAKAMIPFVQPQNSICASVQFAERGNSNTFKIYPDTGLLIEKMLVAFLLLIAEQVTRLVVFKTPSLFCDQTMALPVPIYEHAIQTYSAQAGSCRWSQLPNFSGVDQRRSARINAAGKLPAAAGAKALKGKAGDGALGQLHKKSIIHMLSGLAIAAKGSFHEMLNKHPLNDNIPQMRSTHSLWKTLLLYSRDRFQTVLRAQVEKNNDASPVQIHSLGLYAETARAVSFLKLRNLARYHPVDLIMSLLDQSGDGEACNNNGRKEGNNIRGRGGSPWTDYDAIGNPFYRWAEVVRLGTSIIDSLTMQLQLISTVMPMVAEPQAHTVLAKNSSATVNPIKKRGVDWIVKDESRKVRLQSSCMGCLPTKCRDILWFRHEWEGLDPVRTHQRFLQSGSQKKSSMPQPGHLDGNIFVRSPVQITKALFADAQLCIWVIEAITETLAVGSCRGFDGRAEEPWKQILTQERVRTSAGNIDSQVLGSQFHDMTHQTVPVVLCTLLQCSIAIEEYVASPMFVGGGVPEELKGNQISRDLLLAVGDALSRGITRIVTAYYEHLNTFSFPPEHAIRIAEYARFLK